MKLLPRARLGRLFALVVVCSGASLVRSPSASACTPLPEGIVATYPSTGASGLPINAGVLVRYEGPVPSAYLVATAHELPPLTVQPLIDGWAWVTLPELSDLAEIGPRREVSLYQGGEAMTMAWSVVLTLDRAAHDLLPPRPSIEGLEVVYREAQPCSSPGYYLHVDFTVPVLDRVTYPIAHILRETTPMDGNTVRAVVPASVASSRFEIYLGNDASDDVGRCFSAATLNVAGAWSPSRTDSACITEVPPPPGDAGVPDFGGVDGGSSFDGGAGADAGTVDLGAVDAGVETGELELADEGCRCFADRPRSPWLGLVVLAGAVLSRRRRSGAR